MDELSVATDLRERKGVVCNSKLKVKALVEKNKSQTSRTAVDKELEQLVFYVLRGS